MLYDVDVVALDVDVPVRGKKRKKEEKKDQEAGVAERRRGL